MINIMLLLWILVFLFLYIRYVRKEQYKQLPNSKLDGLDQVLAIYLIVWWPLTIVWLSASYILQKIYPDKEE